jgi:hypothetical protein
VIISNEKNKAYNGLLGTMRKIMCPWKTHNDIRKGIKDMDPAFPMTEDGTKKSTADMTDDEMDAHISFIKTMLVKRGVILEYFKQSEVKEALSKKFDVYFIGEYEEIEDDVIINVVCPNCGAATIRRLTDDRFRELNDIMHGSEVSDEIKSSFMCAWCTEKKDKEKM